MNTYHVIMTEKIVYEFDVNANSYDEAEEKANELFGNNDDNIVATDQYLYETYIREIADEL